MQQRQKQQSLSPYLNLNKTKDSPFLPKIHRFQQSQTKYVISKNNRKQNYPQSIFKQKQKQKQKQQQLQAVTFKAYDIPEYQKIIASKQYLQILADIQTIEQEHQKQMLQLQEKQNNIQKLIKKQQDNSYHNKYAIWELKNQILELDMYVRQEQNQMERLEYGLGFIGAEIEQQYGEYQQELQNQQQGLIDNQGAIGTESIEQDNQQQEQEQKQAISYQSQQ